ncbi:MAG: SEC-C metal-binding domain-containing protein, partial [Planctomycetaceae bacterium]
LATYISFCSHPLVPAPPLFRNGLVMLACLKQHAVLAELLQLAAYDDFRKIVEKGLPRHMHAAVASLIQDVEEWEQLLSETTNEQVRIYLLGALPLIVQRDSLSRADAAARVIRFFDSQPDASQAFLANDVLVVLKDIGAPESMQAAARINALLPQEQQVSQESIEALRTQPDVGIQEALADYSALHLNDPAQALSQGDGSLMELVWGKPDTLADAMEFLKSHHDNPWKVILAIRKLLGEPAVATPLLLEYLRNSLRSRTQSSKPDFGPANTIPILLQLRSTELLPLLLPAWEAHGDKCLAGFSSFAGFHWQSLIAMTAESADYVVEWIHRLARAGRQQLAGEFVRAIAAMVLESRADQVSCIRLLRELFSGWTCNPEDQSAYPLADAAASALIHIGDTQFLSSIRDDPRLRHPGFSTTASLVASCADPDRNNPEGTLWFATEWFLGKRFMGAVDHTHWLVIVEMRKQYQQNSTLSGRSGGDDTGYDSVEEDNFEDDDNPGSITAAASVKPVETIRNTAKIGRNDPCPCGSGRKYKKCCGS